MSAEAKPRVGRNLTEGNILKTLLTFATPIVLTNIVQQLYSAVDLMVIGKYVVGSMGTVSVSTGSEVVDMITTIASAFAGAGQIYIAQLSGAKNRSALKETIGTLVSTMLLISLVLMIGTIAFCRPILGLLNCPDGAFLGASQYMIVTALGMPFIFGYNAICGMLRGMGESRRPLLFVSIAAVVNIILDIILVAVFHLEAIGTAIATVAAQIGSFVAAFYFMYSRREVFGFELKLSYFKIQWHHFKVILLLGIPKMVQLGCVHITQMWCSSNINTFGMVVSATNGIGNKINKFLNVFMLGIDTGAGAMIAQNLGAKKPERAKKTVLTALACTMVLALVFSMAALTIPRQLYGLFSQDADVIEFGVTFMRIMVITFFMSALLGPFQSMVTGSGFASMNFVIGLLDSLVFRIGLSILFANILNWGAIGFFLGNALARLGPAIICLIYFFSGKWKTRKLLSESKKSTHS